MKNFLKLFLSRLTTAWSVVFIIPATGSGLGPVDEKHQTCLITSILQMTMVKNVLIKQLGRILGIILFLGLLPGYGQQVRGSLVTDAQQVGGNQNNARALATADFKGVNWADMADNFKDDQLVIGGLLLTDDYSTVRAKANTILNGFQSVGINTIRIPINYPTVSTAWWNAYSGVIDEASAHGMKVIIAYWEARSSMDGQVDNLTQFLNMWQTVTNKYVGDSNVYFEVMNEPHGYSAFFEQSLCVLAFI